ncbi:hypothetical protein [Hwangdonia sp.]|uniref:hypothetical protein n=1 Tax=Hwangdonia sp. TaxID=1883432 RepID=UPI003AB460DF
MNSRAFLVLLAFLITSCKAAKEKKLCLENVKDKMTLNINSFQELTSYIKIENEDLEEILWIIDGVPVEDYLIVNTINKKDFDLLKVDYLPKAKTLSFCKPSTKVVLILTNNCLKK